MSKGILSFVLICLLFLQVAIVHKLDFAKSKDSWLPKNAYVLPAEVLGITALEFQSLLSDFLFLEAITFYGETLDRTEHPRVREYEWDWLYDVLNASSELDPIFFDPYYFTTAHYPWEGMAVKANNLLDRGIFARDWEWRLPFYAGFNSYFFMQDYDKASRYLMKAAVFEDSPKYLASLASRMAAQSNQTETAIVFLQQMILSERNDSLVAMYTKRLEALSAILFLEKALEVYKQIHGILPDDLDYLVLTKVINQIPSDPYGGTFFIDQNGSVMTTSDFRQQDNGVQIDLDFDVKTKKNN